MKLFKTITMLELRESNFNIQYQQNNNVYTNNNYALSALKEEVFGDTNSSTLNSDKVGSDNKHTQQDLSNTPFHNQREYQDSDRLYLDKPSQTTSNSQGITIGENGGSQQLNRSRPSSGTLIEADKNRNELFLRGNQDGLGLSSSKGPNVVNFFQRFNKINPYSPGREGSSYKSSNNSTIDVDNLNRIINTKRDEILTLKGRWENYSYPYIRLGQKQRPGSGESHGNDARIDNIFAPNNTTNTDYMLRWYENVRSPVERTNNADQTRLAKAGFNAGQSLGGKVFQQRDGYTANRLSPIPNSIEEFIRNQIGTLPAGYPNRTSALEDVKLDLVNAYIPGFNRLPQPYNIRAPLSDYLEQNILLPEGNDSNQTPDGIWSKLWSNNRTGAYAMSLATRVKAKNDSAIADPSLFRKGVLAGVAISEIEEQGSKKGGGRPSAVIDFRDDKNNLSYDAKEMGFINNIPGSVKGVGRERNVSDVSGELPAVTLIESDLKSLNDVHNYGMAKGDEQYFPFLFMTENRKAGNEESEQVCYLQATLDSINETYNPAWQPKHFFGRTEQMHTYTYTDRTIDIGFSIVANTARQLQNVYERVTWLAQQTYGQMKINDNGAPSKLTNSPLVRMTIGDMFASVPGFFKTLSYDWNFLGAGGKWEMSQGLRIPMGVKVQISFQVLHDDLPNRNYSLYGGPVRRTDGLIGSRGLVDGKHGPLIPVVGRNASIPTSGVFTQQKNEMYIDYVARNTSVGFSTDTTDNNSQSGNG